jgi:hypothetical protein
MSSVQEGNGKNIQYCMMRNALIRKEICPKKGVGFGTNKNKGSSILGNKIRQVLTVLRRQGSEKKPTHVAKCYTQYPLREEG